MPGVLAVLQRGGASEWRATLIARETAHLSVEHRGQIDTAIADQVAGWSDARTEREARGWAQRLDPHGAAQRAAKAAVDRRVTIRPAPDCMTYVSALLPVKDGVAVFGNCTAPRWPARPPPPSTAAQGRSWPTNSWSGADAGRRFPAGAGSGGAPGDDRPGPGRRRRRTRPTRRVRADPRARRARPGPRRRADAGMGATIVHRPEDR